MNKGTEKPNSQVSDQSTPIQEGSMRPRPNMEISKEPLDGPLVTLARVKAWKMAKSMLRLPREIIEFLSTRSPFLISGN